MADKIKSMGIKQADGTFGTMIPFGADASNVDFAENKSVADKIGEMDTAIAKNKTDVATKAVKKHDSEAADYGLGSPTKYGHVKIINGLGQAAHEDGTALSAAQGKVLDGKIATEKGRIDTNVSKIATIRTELDQAKTDITGKAPKSHAVTAATYGLGTGTNYGHVKVINNLSQTSNVDGTVLSAYQGKVLNDKIEGAALTLYPVGSVYLSILDSFDPNTAFGGTWELVGSGRYLLGGDGTNGGEESGSETHIHNMPEQGVTGTASSETVTVDYKTIFNTANRAAFNTGANNGNTGSTKLTVAQMPTHNHSLGGNGFSEDARVFNWGMNKGDVYVPSALLYGGNTGDKNALYTYQNAWNRTQNSGSSQGHTHTLGSHTHSIEAHSHQVPPHDHTTEAHTHTTSGKTAAANTGSANNNPLAYTVNMWKRTA